MMMMAMGKCGGEKYRKGESATMSRDVNFIFINLRFKTS